MAEQFFHVDRDRRPHEGQQITLRPVQVTGDVESKVMNNLLPEGASEWGQAMLDDASPLVATIEALRNHGLSRPIQVDGEWGAFVDQNAQAALRAGRNRIIEATAEVVRRGVAPDKPSRLACLYAYRDLAMAERFRDEQNVPDAPIWVVESERGAPVHESDSRLLGIPETTAQFIARTIVYWQGGERDAHAESTTSVEVLLAMPIRIARRAS